MFKNHLWKGGMPYLDRIALIKINSKGKEAKKKENKKKHQSLKNNYHLMTKPVY
jgi:hypothetical protein